MKPMVRPTVSLMTAVLLGCSASEGQAPAAMSPAASGSDSSPDAPTETQTEAQTPTDTRTLTDSETATPDVSLQTPDEILPASEVARRMGAGFNLGQMFDNDQHPRSLAAARAKIDAYYARGFRNLRIPITWTEVVGNDRLVFDPTVGEVDREHPRLRVIEQVVDYALSQPDLYVVINAHHERGLKTEGRAAVLERLWQDISDIFAGRGQRLIFEILNEPHKDDDSAMDAALLRQMTGMAYDRIRAVSAERIVVIGGNQWFSAAEVPAVWTHLDQVGGGDDPHLMVTFHHYDPWSFSGDNQGTYDDPWTEANVVSPMQIMKQWADTVGNGMPVYIGEWGVGWGSVYDQMQCNNVRLWYQNMHTQAEAIANWPTAVWDDGGWFKIFDHASGSFDNDLVDCINATCEWEGERFNAGCS